jgi:hypothetical protein
MIQNILTTNFWPCVTIMEITPAPLQYEPSLADDGTYLDKPPAPPLIAQGIRCSCSARQTIFTSRSSLMLHFKTATHQAWLETQNRNRENHYTEMLELRELVKKQTQLIAERDQLIIKLEKQLRNKDEVIRTLSAMLSSPQESHKTENPYLQEEMTLLDIDP